MDKYIQRLKRKNEIKAKNKLYKKNTTFDDVQPSRGNNVGKPWNTDHPERCSGARSRRILAKKTKGVFKAEKTRKKRKIIKDHLI